MAMAFLFWLCAVLAAAAPAAASPGLAADALVVPAGAPTHQPAAETLIRDGRAPVVQRAVVATASTTAGQTTATETAETAETAATTTGAASDALPSPFDSSRSANFTRSSCPAFLDAFLDSAAFRACYPLSELLQGSSSFFRAEQSVTTITRVLDVACAANVTTCAAYLTALAANLTDDAHCGADYALGNPVATQAYLGMVAYEVLYAATCLKDTAATAATGATGAYCFANAVTNTSGPSNAYFYYLPLNISLPVTAAPACSSCLQQTMAVLRSAAANRLQPIAYTYRAAADKVAAACGASFVDQTLPAAVSAAGRAAADAGGWLGRLALGAAAYVLL